jgi:hypothetical protein
LACDSPAKAAFRFSSVLEPLSAAMRNLLGLMKSFDTRAPKSAKGTGIGTGPSNGLFQSTRLMMAIKNPQNRNIIDCEP